MILKPLIAAGLESREVGADLYWGAIEVRHFVDEPFEAFPLVAGRR